MMDEEQQELKNIHIVRARALYDANGHWYHNWQHVVACLRALDDYAEALGLSESDQLLVSLALIWHDAVYVPGARDNEAESGQQFLITNEELGGVIHSAKVYEMIVDTRHNRLPSSYLGAVVCDIDLDVLAYHADHYASCVQQIKLEYDGAGYTDLEWLVGRKAFLDAMLNRYQTFWTSYGQIAGGERAFRNLTTERSKLEHLDRVTA